MNLHVVVSMDPGNELFRSRCESNPALITRASVQWLEGWSSKGMRAIAEAKLQDLLNSSQDVAGAAKAAKKGVAAPAADLDVMGSMVSMHNMMGEARLRGGDLGEAAGLRAG